MPHVAPTLAEPGLLRAFVRGYAREQRRVARGMADGSQAGCLVLAQLLKGESDQRTLSEDLELDKTLVSRTVKALVANGLVSRGSSPSDGRVSVVALTKTGRRSAMALHRELESLNTRVLAQLSQSEVRTIEPAVKSLSAALKSLRTGEERPGADVVYAPLARGEIRAAATLLEAEGLPIEDLRDERLVLIGARAKGVLVGCIGLEGAARCGLVRSLVVAPALRGRGLAHALYERLLVEAHRRKLAELYLLTDTAEAFFRRLGFSRVDRKKVPVEIQRTRQFSSLCPASTAVLRRSLSDVATSFARDGLHLRPDVDGARYFALSLQRTTLSYYEVDAGARFPRHAHDVEQLTLVIDGRLDFEFDDRKVSIGPGEAVAIPPGVMHAVRGGEAATRAVDAWGPARQDM